MLFIIVPTSFERDSKPLEGDTSRRTILTTRNYGAPYHDSKVILTVGDHQMLLNLLRYPRFKDESLKLVYNLVKLEN